MVDIPEQAVEAGHDGLPPSRQLYIYHNDVREILTAAAPYMSGVKVKQLEWREVKSLVGRKLIASDCFGREFARIDLLNHTHDELDIKKAEYQANYENGILSALEPSSAREQALEGQEQLYAAVAAIAVLTSAGVPQDLQELLVRGDVARGIAPGSLSKAIAAAIRDLSSQRVADEQEKAWYFKKGDAVPEWLERVEEGNCVLTFGVNVVVTSKEGFFEIRPNTLKDNSGPIIQLDGPRAPQNVHIRGGGKGVNIVGYTPPITPLPQDVINLVIAAREACDTWQLPEEEFKNLDAAIEVFASRIPYEDQPSQTGGEK